MFDFNADPERVAARAAELAIEQHDRLSNHLSLFPDEGDKFYQNAFEISITNQIANLMCGYAVLKGLIPPERVGLKK